MSGRERRLLDLAGVPGAHPDSPQVQERLGAELARLIKPLHPDVIAYWRSQEAAVLAHIVARSLGIDVLAAHEDLGRLEWARTPEPGTAAVLADLAWNDYPGPDALARMITNAGCKIAGAATVLADARGDQDLGVEVHVLENGRADT